MDKRGYPYDQQDANSRQQQAMNVQMAKQALEMEEALMFQRQQEFDRDLQLQRLILQEQLQQEAMSSHGLSNALGLHNSGLYGRFGLGGGGLGGGGLGGGGMGAGGNSLAAQYEQELILQQQDQLRRQQQLQQQLQAQQQQQQQAQQQQQQQKSQQQSNDLANEKLIAESLAANAMRRSGLQRKRSFDQSGSGDNESGPTKRPARSESISSDKGSSKIDGNDKPKKGRKKGSPSLTSLKPKKQDPSLQAKKRLSSVARLHGSDTAAAIEALTSVGSDLGVHSFRPVVKGTIDSLLSAAKGEDKADSAAETIVNFKKTVSFMDLVDEQKYEEGEVIDLPNFKSALPKLPVEPEYNVKMDRTSKEEDTNSIAAKMKAEALRGTSMAPGASKAGALSMTVEYPYPVDTWWPSINNIRKERRAKEEQSDEEDFNDEPKLSTEIPFRADMQQVLKRLAAETEPGVLEKVAHCRIHRIAMKSQKVANAPDHAFCWQVTENYCNDPMVCCSVCSSWRHARCGGHYKAFTVKDTADNEFVPVCDRCHAEQEILRQQPSAATRLERQRVEQLRRGLATSHVIRQASFAKHQGTYKWPLGSVSSTHIGGHARSVHSRHDKAEKQWSEMVTRLSRTSGYRPKERIKVRTRELERLLVSIEDSEGITDRHNMVLFLQQDLNAGKPVGYEHHRRNIFDPEDDEAPLSLDALQHAEEAENVTPNPELVPEGSDDAEIAIGRRVFIRKVTPTSKHSNSCALQGCPQKPRFDSIFCSDACGVAALQLDLLQSLQYANDIHPSLLRS